MNDLSLDNFSGSLGEEFSVPHGGDQLALILEEAQELPGSARQSGGFRLEFRGPCEPVLPQAIYSLNHRGESYDIFIVPVGRKEDGVRYEAVFF